MQSNTTDFGIGEVIAFCQGECPQRFRDFSTNCRDLIEDLNEEDTLPNIDLCKDCKKILYHVCVGGRGEGMSSTFASAMYAELPLQRNFSLLMCFTETEICYDPCSVTLE